MKVMRERSEFRGRTLSGAAIILLLMLVALAGTAAAAGLVVEVGENVLEPGAEIPVKVKLVGDDGEIINADRRVLVRVNAGGLLDLRQLQEGIMLEEGEGSFTYLAPESDGEVEIRLLELESRSSATVNFKIAAGSSQGEWEEKFATLKGIRGRVFVKPAAENFYDTARKLQRVYQGDRVQTMKHSWVDLVLYDESEVTLEPLTELIIHNLSTLREDREVKQGVFELLKGTVLCTANEYLNKGSRFTVETESATAGVRGTFFEVSQTEDGRTRVRVFSGSVKTTHRDTGRVFVVGAGQQMVMPEGDEEPEVTEHNLTPEEKQEQVQQAQQAAEEGSDNGSGGNEESGDNQPDDSGSGSGGNGVNPVPVWEGNVEIVPDWGIEGGV